MLEEHPMSHSTRLLALVVAGLLAAVPTRAAPALTLKSVKVELPDSDTSFQGPGADALNNNCLSCHSVGMVLNQPALPPAVWRATVEKMIHVRSQAPAFFSKPLKLGCCSAASADHNETSAWAGTKN
jgi:hypothetical protein